VIDDKADDYQQTGVIAEGARIPIRSLKTDQKSVTFHKFGGGYEFTYEFERRVSLDIVTPYANRIEREVQIGQVGMVTDLLVNGDGVNGAAPVVNASDLGAAIVGNAAVAAGRMDWEIFLKWLISRAQAGTPVDTVVGNWDMYFEWERMFATPPTAPGRRSSTCSRRPASRPRSRTRVSTSVNFAVSSAAPAAKLLGFIKGETIEELKENGSDIEESIRSIENQKVRYVKTKNHGYRLVFADTRRHPEPRRGPGRLSQVTEREPRAERSDLDLVCEA
jgi:predicted transcriptional regulator